jgi:hypothetical protein
LPEDEDGMDIDEPEAPRDIDVTRVDWDSGMLRALLSIDPLRKVTEPERPDRTRTEWMQKEAGVGFLQDRVDDLTDWLSSTTV